MKMMNIRTKTVVATASVAAAGGLVFGATEAFAASPSASSSGSPSATASAGATSGKGRHACDSSKQTTKTKAAKKGSQSAAPRHARACAARGFGLDRAQLFKRGAHGQETVKDKTGAYVVEEWQVGKVKEINGSSVSVTDASGTTWTWTVQTATKFNVDGKSGGALSGVHVGDTVMMRGTQSGSANDATAVVDPDQSKLG